MAGMIEIAGLLFVNYSMQDSLNLRCKSYYSFFQLGRLWFRIDLRCLLFWRKNSGIRKKRMPLLVRRDKSQVLNHIERNLEYKLKFIS